MITLNLRKNGNIPSSRDFLNKSYKGNEKDSFRLKINPPGIPSGPIKILFWCEHSSWSMSLTVKYILLGRPLYRREI